MSKNTLKTRHWKQIIVNDSHGSRVFELDKTGKLFNKFKPKKHDRSLDYQKYNIENHGPCNEGVENPVSPCSPLPHQDIDLSFGPILGHSDHNSSSRRSIDTTPATPLPTNEEPSLNENSNSLFPLGNDSEYPLSFGIEGSSGDDNDLYDASFYFFCPLNSEVPQF